MNYLRALRHGHKRPIIAIIMAGSPADLSEVHELADAILYAWYPGEEGGKALADIIFGKVSPSGRLPITFPRSLSQIPDYEDYSMQGRTYKFMKEEPMYPFGFGLSYSRFQYSQAQPAVIKLAKGEKSNIKIKVSNIGNYDSDEVVQLYVSYMGEFRDAPKYSLKGIKRIHIEAGSSQEVKFELIPDMFELYNEKGEIIIPSGDYKVYIGGSLPDKRSTDLGSAKWTEVIVSID